MLGLADSADRAIRARLAAKIGNAIAKPVNTILKSGGSFNRVSGFHPGGLTTARRMPLGLSHRYPAATGDTRSTFSTSKRAPVIPSASAFAVSQCGRLV